MKKCYKIKVSIGDKMKEKGFTLIEMLAVFIIISIIMVVALPAITKNLKGNSKKEYTEFIKTVELATEVYVEDNREMYPLNTVGATATITIGTLKEENLIDNIPNKPDGTEITDDMTVKVTVNSDYTLKYEFQG